MTPVFPACRGYRETDSEQANRDDLTVEFLFNLRASVGDEQFKQYLSEELS